VDLSCKSEYALLALLELASEYEASEPLQIRQIATKQNIPDRYLEQLLATLRRHGLVRSQRGAKGGYLLAREPWSITLFEVITCIEGTDSRQTPNAQDGTLETLIVHDVWQEVDQAVETILHKYTLKDLIERRNARRQLDLMYYI
jgi:Rrf2 family protein